MPLIVEIAGVHVSLRLWLRTSPAGGEWHWSKSECTCNLQSRLRLCLVDILSSTS